MRFKGSRFRPILYALILFFCASIIFLRHDLGRRTGPVSWYDSTLIWITAPFEEGLFLTRSKVSSIFQRYFLLIGVERENEALREKITNLEMGRTSLAGLEQENRRLLGLLDLEKRSPGRWVAARVAAYAPGGPHRILTVNKGARDGILPRSPVIASDGLVGQVSRVFANYSQILLINDPISAVDGQLEHSGARGLIVGKAIRLMMDRESYITALEYLNRSTEMGQGAKVVTSGMDGIYPPGIPIGTVRGSEKKKYDVFQQAEVVPSVDFSKVREVLILIAEQKS